MLEQDPWSDGVTKFTTAMGRWTAGVYDDDRWEIVYRLLDDRFVEVLGISRVAA